MKLPPLHFTFLNTWSICPHQAARRYILKDLPRTAPSPEMKWGDDVHKDLEARVRDKTPLPTEMAKYEPYAMVLDKYKADVETKLAVTRRGESCSFFDNDRVFFRGKLDIVLRGENYVLLDWKTGGSKYENPLELQTGAVLLAADRDDGKSIFGRYVWLKEGRLGTDYDLSSALTATWSLMLNFADRIQEAINKNYFPKLPGPLCTWCPVRDCQHNKAPPL
jgi:PD-(D/E)XK nuclease superfamily protein